jgi:hypothetical protein
VFHPSIASPTKLLRPLLDPAGSDGRALAAAASLSTAGSHDVIGAAALQQAAAETEGHDRTR